MGKRQEIHFIDVRHSLEAVLMPDAFRFVPKGRFQWLQRVAWKLLHRMGALDQAYDSRMKVERRVIDADTFMERLYQQRGSLFREFDRQGKRLLIGAEDYAELMREAAMSQPFSFSAELFGPNRQVMGLTVDVVPWIRGVAVMP